MIDFDVNKTKEKLDEFTKALIDCENADISSMGKMLESGMNDAMKNNDLTKLNKLLKYVNNYQ